MNTGDRPQIVALFRLASETRAAESPSTGWKNLKTSNPSPDREQATGDSVGFLAPHNEGKTKRVNEKKLFEKSQRAF